MTLIPYRNVRTSKWMNDLFDNFINHPVAGFDSREVMFSRPSVNIREEKDEFVVEIASPGLKKSDFTLKVEDGKLTVSVDNEKNVEEKEEGKYFRREFNYARFQRVFQLPETVDSEKTNASYNDGVLAIHLPKMEAAKKDPVKTIEIQ